MSAKKYNIILSGMIAGNPHQGGAVWAVLQYLLGFKRLGHQVCFIEPVKSEALRPAGSSLAESENARYFRQIVAEFDLAGDSALLLEDSNETVGLPFKVLRERAGRADLLINISGMLKHELAGGIPLRIYLDLDPAFNQLWHAVEGLDVGFADHTHFVTIGESLGQADCDVPLCGREWLTTKQPVVLSYWPRGNGIRHDALTSIGNWRGYGSIDDGAKFYGQKAHSLRRFVELPKLTTEKFKLAFAIDPGEINDLAALDENGWQLVDPADCAGTPAQYQKFIQQSKGEFGIAKSGYVISRCGWFSDRSVCYLTSGRPVIAQETGFSRHLPTGLGLFAFTDKDEVLSAVNEINRNYARHSNAARAVAEEHFDSGKVLSRFLTMVGA